MKKNLLAFLVILTLSYATPAAAFEPLGLPDPDDMEYESSFDLNEDMINLGRMLFFDPRLSYNYSQSCATCHNPDLGFGDGFKKGLGANGKKLSRNVPHIYNQAWASSFFWDGRIKSLEKQAIAPIESPAEMNLKVSELAKRLQKNAIYRRLFQKAFGSKTINKATIAAALAAFESTIIVQNTPFDQYVRGNKNALSPSQKRGLKLFKKKARCVKCHDGPNFTDNGFHNTGLKSKDVGRFAVVAKSNFKGAFKTPGLRNTSLTAPYMHNGSLSSLEEVVLFYNKGGEKVKHKDSLMKKLDLSNQEIFDLVAFLGALTEKLTTTRPTIPK